MSQTLIEAKKLRVDYLKTDTHWNKFGGFVAYRALVKALARQMPGLEPLPMDTYDWKPAVRPGRELTVIMGMADAYTETQAVEPVPLKPCPLSNCFTTPCAFPKETRKNWTPAIL